METEDDGKLGAKAEVSTQVPMRIKELKFGILSPPVIVKDAALEITDRHIYDIGNGSGGGGGGSRPVTANGPLDRRMGVATATAAGGATCATCKGSLQECNGHFGYVRLALPVFHIGFMKRIVDTLHGICKDCARVLLDEERRRYFLSRLRASNTDAMKRDQICKAITMECRKRKDCPYCGAVNGPIKKVPGHPLKIIHEKYKWYNTSLAKFKVAPKCKEEFEKSFDEARKHNPELEKHLKRAVDDLNPLRVLNLFKRVTTVDCELLGLNAAEVRPEMLIWQYVPAPPVGIRPSIAQESASTEDDITNKLGDIVHLSTLMRAGLQNGTTISQIMETWDALQINVGKYINSEHPGLQRSEYGKPMRGFCQRLKGKQGRFRGNLSGKRVDFSARTVISPDPNLGIDEVAVPDRVAMNLTYPEKVTLHNIEKLRNCVRNGKTKHPGANFVIKSGGRKIVLEILERFNKLDTCANELSVGDTVERHLEDGDIVLFNRQPSLHKLSILSHRVKVRQWRTFRLNECVCTPYNADFDGDEMNLHVPQTEEARTEAYELMNVRHNLATPKDGTPIIAATQDFITAAYLLSDKDKFFDRKTFAQICSYMFDANGVVEPIKKENIDSAKDEFEFLNIDLPDPVILKPEMLWSGKQVFNVLMRPNKRSSVLVNFDAACREYRPRHQQAPELDANDSWLCIRNSEVMCGVMDKNTLGAGNKDSIFYVIMRDFGPDCAVQAMNRLAKLSARWLSNEGLSIGIDDVYPNPKLVKEKQLLIEKAYVRCDKLIEEYSNGTIQRDPGCDQEQTMENRMSGVLNEVRQKAGELCFQQLSKHNTPVIMATCGAKGSNLNVSQMVAAVGQQIIGGARVADGFHDRTLPHFPKAARNPASKGFVYNSFFSGLTPTEFLFHAMSGREGLVDTAVKTAETGYMSRRLMKSLEDLSTQYDDTVRNSSSGVVQFQYGDDRLDPVDMEGKSKPVNFQRTWTHAIASTWDGSDRGLLPTEAMEITRQALRSHWEKLKRMTLLGEELAYDDDTDYGLDQYESNRGFLNAIEDCISAKAKYLESVREQYNVAAKAVGKRKRRKTTTEIQPVGVADEIAKISEAALKKFLTLCLSKYEKSKTQPGHAVGAVGAQSIGEPGTQMTLKTFHFAGVAGMSITKGVPRIKEIINASKIISTPVITCELNNKVSETAARLVKSRIEKTYMRDVLDRMEDVWWREDCYIFLKIDMQRIAELSLDVTMDDIKRALVKTRTLRLDETSIKPIGTTSLRLYLHDVTNDKKSRPKLITKDQQEEYFIRMQNLTRMLPNVVIKGYADASRAVIAKTGTTNADGIEENRLLVEGYGLKACMTTPGIDGPATRTNSVMETHAVLGIEAARAAIIAELDGVLGAQMGIDPRHLQLLADVMTSRGDVLGITRFGLAKMRDSVLQLASFEKTPDHLFDAAVKGKRDAIEGVSECIILGQSMTIGTGAMSVVRGLGLRRFGGAVPAFEKAYNDLRAVV